VLKAEVLLHVLLPLFFLPPRSGVAFLRPERRRRLCGGVPAGVGGFGILPQLVNGSVEGVSSEVMAWLAFEKAPLRAQYSA
jgi:hypothetical protein